MIIHSPSNQSIMGWAIIATLIIIILIHPLIGSSKSTTTNTAKIIVLHSKSNRLSTFGFSRKILLPVQSGAKSIAPMVIAIVIIVHLKLVKIAFASIMKWIIAYIYMPKLSYNNPIQKIRMWKLWSHELSPMW